MREPGDQARAAAGFTVKSGWASAVLLIGSGETLRVVDSGIRLSEAGIDAMKGALGYFGRLGDRVVRLGFPDPSIAAGEVTVTDVGTS